ncbi:MAG: hypothetical protein LBR36_02785 [Bacteroidales bacterium]|jgi:hypothetical protein|nr:hypothetical protein [Bacteroidales bacterium]
MEPYIDAFRYYSFLIIAIIKYYQLKKKVKFEKEIQQEEITTDISNN